MRKAEIKYDISLGGANGTDISKTPIPKGSADIICAFQTLEHVNDPVGFLKTLGVRQSDSRPRVLSLFRRT